MSTPRPGVVVFRCDGDERVGAGHVARCLQLALAFRAAGAEAVFAGSYSGIAERLLRADGMPTERGQIPAEAGAVVVDSYEIGDAEVEALAAERPTAAITDGSGGPRATALLSYHLDAEARVAVPEGTVAVLGPDYAPVRPTSAAARRQRGFERLLVTVGGGAAGAHLLDEVVTAALELPGLELFVAGAGAAVPSGAESRVRQAVVEGGLAEQVAWADAAVSTAGSTPYELACAGVPSLLLAIADNQAATMRGFVEGSLAHALDAREPEFGQRLRAGLALLADPAERERLAAAGPAAIDGYGAFRARDALAAAFAGRPQPRVLRYRPATEADAGLLLAWRNDPEVRAVSRSGAEIAPEEHAEWLRSVLADPQRTLLVVEESGGAIGTVRFDADPGGDEAEISVTVAPGHRGGTGTQAIAQAGELYLAAHPHVAQIRAEVGRDNERSLRAFARAGYEPAGHTADGERAILARRPAP